MFTSIAPPLSSLEAPRVSDRELADIGITRSDIDRIAEQEAHK